MALRLPVVTVSPEPPARTRLHSLPLLGTGSAPPTTVLPEEGSSGNLPTLGGPDLMLEENPGDPGLQPCCAEVAKRGQAVGGTEPAC